MNWFDCALYVTRLLLCRRFELPPKPDIGVMVEVKAIAVKNAQAEVLSVSS